MDEQSLSDLLVPLTVVDNLHSGFLQHVLQGLIPNRGSFKPVSVLKPFVDKQVHWCVGHQIQQIFVQVIREVSRHSHFVISLYHDNLLWFHHIYQVENEFSCGNHLFDERHTVLLGELRNRLCVLNISVEH